MPIPTRTTTPVTVGDTGTSTDTVQSYTTGASDTYLLVLIGIRGASLSDVQAVTFGAVSLGILANISNGSNMRAVIAGGFVDPSTTDNVTVDYLGGNANAVIAILSYEDVDSEGTPDDTVATAGTTSSVTLASVTDARCVDFIVTAAADDNPSAGSGAAEFTRFHDGASQVEMDGRWEDEATTLAWSGITHSNGDSIHIGIPLVGTSGGGGGFQAAFAAGANSVIL